MKFVDEVFLTVTSGNGGPGCISFRRESKVPRGGPDGGDGGKGGDVIVKVNRQLNSLMDLRYKKNYSAGHGMQGSSSLSTGADGKDMVIYVPEGTVIKSKEGQLLGDMAETDEIVLLEGGRGGKGNHFYKSSINQAPEKAQKGESGLTKDIWLELKLLADIGIIGFPNVGKSTLISHISAAKPKIADYPFTTLVPNLGVVRVGDQQSFVVADIPGLVADAHKGVGLGHQFLRHIERTRAFIHVVDASENSGRHPLEDYEAINYELSEYDKNKFGEEGYIPLSKRQQIVVLNKVDTITEDRLKDIIKEFAEKGVNIFPVSAVTGKNIHELIYKAGNIVFAQNSSNNMVNGDGE